MNERPQFELRSFSSPADYAECVRLQRLTWGEDFKELVPPVILMLTQKVGGVAAGAFSDDGRMVGFVYGLTGFRDGMPVHWSHMLAVEPAFEGMGIGRQLKELQRDLMLARGIKLVSWTFDPLVARNAHLNFNKLGAVVTEYVQDMYGTDTGSLLHSGLGTDRFIVDWPLEEKRVEDTLAGRRANLDSRVTAAPIVNTDESGTEVVPVEVDLPDSSVVRIEIPRDIEQIKAESMDLGKRWRSGTRRAFQFYMARDYAVDGFYDDAHTGRCFYYLVRHQGAGV